MKKRLKYTKKFDGNSIDAKRVYSDGTVELSGEITNGQAETTQAEKTGLTFTQSLKLPREVLVDAVPALDKLLPAALTTETRRKATKENPEGYSLVASESGAEVEYVMFDDTITFTFTNNRQTRRLLMFWMKANPDIEVSEGTLPGNPKLENYLPADFNLREYPNKQEMMKRALRQFKDHIDKKSSFNGIMTVRAVGNAPAQLKAFQQAYTSLQVQIWVKSIVVARKPMPGMATASHHKLAALRKHRKKDRLTGNAATENRRHSKGQKRGKLRSVSAVKWYKPGPNAYGIVEK